jgi:hypothetical protein
MCEGRQADEVEGLIDTVTDFAARLTRCLQSKRHVLRDREPRKQSRSILKYNAPSTDGPRTGTPSTEISPEVG